MKFVDLIMSVDLVNPNAWQVDECLTWWETYENGHKSDWDKILISPTLMYKESKWLPIPTRDIHSVGENH